MVVVEWLPEGLPPRGRGRARGQDEPNLPTKITPAWAGKSRRQGRDGRPSQDYPRVGGEEVCDDWDTLFPEGLPPRGRGRDRPGDTRGTRPGITPAWAGKRATPTIRMAARTDYPRVGGEEGFAHPGVATGFGLPPRGRGRGATRRGWPPVTGITPAWAGKSLSSPSSEARHEDYPRVGGEERAPTPPACPLGGLPPRGRGRAGHVCPGEPRARITPAWAGKRRAPRAPRKAPRDYPRVGGEESRRRRRSAKRRGLPPRGRGRVILANVTYGGMRITPAWAGKSRRQQGRHPAK